MPSRSRNRSQSESPSLSSRSTHLTTRNFTRPPAGFWRVPIIYAVLVVILWPLPLLGLLHVESSAVVAATAYFAAGLSSISLFRRGHVLSVVIVRQLVALIVPLVLLTASLLWRPNCGYRDGLLFFGLFPIVTVIFAVGLAYALDQWNVRWRSGWFVIVGLAVCLLGPIYDIGFHPQFYTYNHVFGGVLGPVYDEELAVRPGLFAFRGVTLVWASLFILAGRIAKHRNHSNTAGDRIGVFAVAGLLAMGALLVLAYASATQLGFNTTTATIKAALPGHVAAEHFDIHYDPEGLSDVDVQVMVDEHEFRYRNLVRALDVEIEDRIQSFIYPNHEMKSRLTGARYTNVAPVWLSTPQSHVLASEFAAVFPHELAHIFSREFGLPILRASLAVGLVEGLAVALEPPDGLPTPHEQMSAALLARVYDDPDGDKGDAESAARQLAGAVASHLSPLGFWTGRGAVSYTTMGSFVRYLLDAYGVEPMKTGYATGELARAYGKSVEQLTAEWAESLLSLPAVASSSGPLVTARFAVPSILEKRCPHYVPTYRLEYRRAATALVREDSATALGAVASSLEREPRYVPSLDLWARLMLADGREKAVRARIEPQVSDSMTAALLVRLGDARSLTGDSTRARAAYERALDRLPSFAHEDASRIYLRHAAAGRPSLLRSIVAGTLPPDGNDPITSIARSFALARLERYEQAADILRTTPEAIIDDPIGWDRERIAADALRRRRLVWLARFNYLAGAHTVASTYAERAAKLYRDVGAYNQAKQLEDFQDMMLWLAAGPTRQSRSMPAGT